MSREPGTCIERECCNLITSNQTGPIKRYCGKKCRKRDENRRRLDRQRSGRSDPQPFILKCKRCGTAFEAKRQTAMYCSKTCATPKRVFRGVHQVWGTHDCPGNRCYWCGLLIDSEWRHRDHVMPRTLGGPNSKENIVFTCPTCNIRKGSRHPLEWIAELVTEPDRTPVWSLSENLTGGRSGSTSLE